MLIWIHHRVKVSDYALWHVLEFKHYSCQTKLLKYKNATILQGYDIPKYTLHHQQQTFFISIWLCKSLFRAHLFSSSCTNHLWWYEISLEIAKPLCKILKDVFLLPYVHHLPLYPTSYTRRTTKATETVTKDDFLAWICYRKCNKQLIELFDTYLLFIHKSHMIIESKH